MRVVVATLVVVALLVVVGLVTDRTVAAVAEQRIAEQVSTTLDAPVAVELPGTVVGLRLLTGHIPRLEIHAQDVPLQDDAHLDRLDVTLTNVRVTLSQLRGDSARLPPAGQARFRAEVGAEAVTRLLALPGLVNVDFADGRLQLSLGDFSIDAEVGADDGDLLIQPQSSLAEALGLDRFTVDLSDQPGSPAVDDAEVTGESLILRGRLEAVVREHRSSRGVTEDIDG